MKFLRIIGIGALLLGVLAGLWGCDVAKIKDLSVTSVGVKYLVPTSSRSMDAVLLLGLDNPSISFTVQDVTGVVKRRHGVCRYMNCPARPSWRTRSRCWTCSPSRRGGLWKA